MTYQIDSSIVKFLNLSLKRSGIVKGSEIQCSYDVVTKEDFVSRSLVEIGVRVHFDISRHQKQNFFCEYRLRQSEFYYSCHTAIATNNWPVARGSQLQFLCVVV